MPSIACPPDLFRRPRLLAAAACLGVLLGCGGGDGGRTEEGGNRQALAAAAVRSAPVVGPGELKSATPIRTVELAAMASVFATVPELGVQAKYAVTTYRLTYVTKDGDGQDVVASALAAVPVKPAGRPSPVMSWQHGTLFLDAQAPSNTANESEAAVLLASQGYIVVAADYVGYGASKGRPHPYLLSAPTAAAVVDLLTAAKTWRATSGVVDNGQLFMAGYSEGGYATVAALRSMETTGSPHLANLVGVAPGAGPYSVTATMDAALAIVRQRSELLRWVAWPGVLKNLSTTTRTLLRDALVHEILPDDADVTLTTSFIDLYLADDTAALDALSNVHDWRPTWPVLLHHGRDDRTVAYSVATRTIATMRANGSTSASLTDCPVQPAGHLDCVVPYFSFLLSRAAGAARDL
ncbi:alpha/beta hydrolase family protein [Pseudaquabacterium terrae]|uniref:alpha/beta hydrolase family protein n=1 Tax=Pseudaquabacterium terrae TaxID=2732868 RepID=UPI0031B646B1